MCRVKHDIDEVIVRIEMRRPEIVVSRLLQHLSVMCSSGVIRMIVVVVANGVHISPLPPQREQRPVPLQKEQRPDPLHTAHLMVFPCTWVIPLPLQ